MAGRDDMWPSDKWFEEHKQDCSPRKTRKQWKQEAKKYRRWWRKLSDSVPVLATELRATKEKISEAKAISSAYHDKCKQKPWLDYSEELMRIDHILGDLEDDKMTKKKSRKQWRRQAKFYRLETRRYYNQFRDAEEEYREVRKLLIERDDQLRDLGNDLDFLKRRLEMKERHYRELKCEMVVDLLAIGQNPAPEPCDQDQEEGGCCKPEPGMWPDKDVIDDVVSGRIK